MGLIERRVEHVQVEARSADPGGRVVAQEARPDAVLCADVESGLKILANLHEPARVAGAVYMDLHGRDGTADEPILVGVEGCHRARRSRQGGARREQSAQ
jgi:hypothetical protein